MGRTEILALVNNEVRYGVAALVEGEVICHAKKQRAREQQPDYAVS